jgi:hypothetical protein
MVAKVVGPILAGAVLAGVALFALVAMQTAPPTSNPASQALLTYGDR